MGGVESGAESAGDDRYTVPITDHDQEQHGASYLGARPDSSKRYTPVPLTEILSQPSQWVYKPNTYNSVLTQYCLHHCTSFRETANSLICENEKKAILKIEANFIQQKSDLFLFMLDCISAQIVTAELASEDWKQSLREYCLSVLVRTKKRTRSHSISNLESLLPRMPETFQINMPWH